MTIDDKLKDMYLDYFNNFLTVSAFASAYFVNEDKARSLIETGKRLYEESIINQIFSDLNNKQGE